MTAAHARAARWSLTAAVVLLLALAARTVDWTETWQAVRGASPALLAAAAVVNLLSLATRALRWWIFLRRVGVPRPATALRGAVVGSGLNNVLPASGGEAARVLLVAREAGISSAAVLATLALDRLVEVLSCAALLVAAPLLLTLPAPLARWRIPAAAVFATLLLVAVLLARRAARTARGAAATEASGAAPVGTQLAVPAGPAVPPRRRVRLRAYGAAVGAALTSLPTPRRLAAAVVLSVLSWIGQAAAYHLAARAVGFPASAVASLAAMLAVNLAFVVQVTPGNVGIFQLVYALVMSAFGRSHHAAVGVALLIQAVQILPVTALAAVLAPGMLLGRLSGREPPADGRAAPSRRG